jgi:alkylhydroperoxidase/carboxymuconolactone decarboxylase family protein YurZ
MSKFREHAQVAIFGTVWARPGLDYKTRTLVCVVSDIATGRHPELATHARMAMRQGWTRDELIEVALHLQAYVGAPLAREGLQTLRDVFAEESQ